jgi:hypothetical protein
LRVMPDREVEYSYLPNAVATFDLNQTDRRDARGSELSPNSHLDRYLTGQHELTICGAQGAVGQVFNDGKRCYDRIGIVGGTAEDRATIRFVQDGENDCGPYSVSVGSR